MLTLNSILALVSLAIIALSSTPVQVNALVADRAQVARHIHAHDAVAKRKRDTSCIPRPSSTTTSSTPTSTPPSTSTTPSTTYTAPSATPSSGSKKWGLAFNADPAVLPNFDLPRVGFFYNWGATLPSNIPSGIAPALQLWGQDQSHIDLFQSTVAQGGANIVFGMNEPNIATQSNMTPLEGYNLWMQYINGLASEGYYRVSPACTNDQTGMDWYTEFFNYCNADPTCGFDAIAVHAYTTDIDSLIEFVTNLHTTFGKGVWITECADQNYSGTGGQPDSNAVGAFAAALVNFVEDNYWIEAAFPFGIVDEEVYTQYSVDLADLLLGSDGYPTDLAHVYFGNVSTS